MMEQLPPRIQKLSELGDIHIDNLLAVVNQWPTGELSQLHSFRLLNRDERGKITGSLLSIKSWLHLLWKEIEVPSIHSKPDIVELFNKLQRIVKDANDLGALTFDIEEWRNEVSSIITSIPPDHWPDTNPGQLFSRFTPNTAFILMWMDQSRRELTDTYRTIKEVCARFNIQALRSDDVQTSESITRIVLTHIAHSEYVIADMTGERPNVYYEVGYAHALNKQIIIYRKVGTVLHFDLANYNVPEYIDSAHLEALLTMRLSEMRLSAMPRREADDT